MSLVDPCGKPFGFHDAPVERVGPLQKLPEKPALSLFQEYVLVARQRHLLFSSSLGRLETAYELLTLIPLAPEALAHVSNLLLLRREPRCVFLEAAPLLSFFGCPVFFVQSNGVREVPKPPHKVDRDVLVRCLAAELFWRSPCDPRFQ